MKVFNYKGGIKPQKNLEQAALKDQHNFYKISNINKLYLSTFDGHNYAGTPIVKIGQVVKAYEPLTATNEKNVVLHSPINATVIDICDMPYAHISSLKVPTIVLEKNNHDEIYNLDYNSQLDIIRQAGIIGLGGAGFPTFLKLKNNCKMLIINAVECEPPITADFALIMHYTQEITDSIEFLYNNLKPESLFLAVKDKIIYETLNQYLSNKNIKLVLLSNNYPQGNAKHLIYSLTGIALSPKEHASSYGIVTINVATAHAIYKALTKKQPLINRIVTITGPLVNKPGNYLLPIGTPIIDLINIAQIDITNGFDITQGGYFMGQSIPQSASILKTTNCLIFSKKPQLQQKTPCIRCNLCVPACPMGLLPQELYWHAKSENFEKLNNFYIDSCIECGCCDTACPSELPLTAYFSYAKNKNKHKELQKKISNISKERFEAKEQREKLKASKKAEYNLQRQLNRKNLLAAALNKNRDNANE